jgi:hypothetical protein
MKKTILALLATGLLAASIGSAAASERHHNYIKRSDRAVQTVRPSPLNANAEYRAPGWSYQGSALQNADEAAMSSGIAGH